MFQYKYINQFPDNAQQENSDGQCIYKMHHLQVKAGGPVRIFLSEKIHRTNIWGKSLKQKD